MDWRLREDLDIVRQLVARRYQSPTREWPLVFVRELNALLVVREWPGGHITAYAMPRDSNGDPEGR